MQQALLIIEALKDQFFSSAGCLNRSDLPLSIGLLIASFVVGLSYDTHATPIISEFLAINDSVHADEDGEFSDWLEIYNPDAETVELGGYFLSDDPDNLVKWRLPDTALDPGARLIIFASGKDRKNANLQLHTNFSLSGQGEYLALTEPDGTTVTSEYSPAFPVQKANVSYGMGIAAGAVSQKKLIVTGGSARFHVPRAELAQDWRVPEFDDKAWTQASTPLGFGYPEMPPGPGGDLGHPVMQLINTGVYVRLPFEITDPAVVEGMVLRIKCDDGFLAYVNGTLAAKSNAPAQPVFDSIATDSMEIEAGDPFDEFVLNFTGSLSVGTNILAIHGLNNSLKSSDFLLIPELEAAIREPGGTLIAGHFNPPTPGNANGTPFQRVADTRFTKNGGFFDAPVEVGISSRTEGAQIRFTVDGSAPSNTHGTLYTGPIQISTTTTLRAIAFKAGLRPTNVDTQSYFFIEDVIRQDMNPARMPASWAGGGTPDYGMDPQVTGDPRFNDIIDDALLSIPTVSLVMNTKDLFDPSFGIYANPGNCCNEANRGPNWERPVSLEYFTSTGVREFQVDAGIRIQGGASRQINKSPKHSLRILFKETYGPAKLEFKMFKDSMANRYDTFSLRSGYLDSWIHDGAWGVGEPRPQAQYVIDKFVHDTFGLMGQTSVKGNYAHLYINGHYWGLYNPIERIRASWLSELFGGSKEDWDVVNLDVGRLEIQDGDTEAYIALLNLVNRGVSSPEEFQAIAEVLDLTNLIDYMLINFWIGNNDWPGSNWTAARRREPPGKYRFFTWDAESSMETVDINVTGLNQSSSPAHIFHRLRSNDEFRLMVADRIQKHFFNNGVLAPEVAAARYSTLTEEIEIAIIAESARWGDYRRDVNPIQRGPYDLYTRDDHWVQERARLLQSYFPRRTGIVFNQLRALDLYPEIASPEFLVDGVPQHGGTISESLISFSPTTSGAIYYTLDGTDPRASSVVEDEDPGVLLDEPAASVRALVPSAANGGDALAIAAWTGLDAPPNIAQWKSGNTPVAFEASPGDYADLIGLDVTEMWPRNATCYIRIPFSITDEQTLAAIGTLNLEMKYDDGFVAYLNGTKVAERNAPANLTWTSAGTASNDDEDAVVFEPIDISAHREALKIGPNLLAIHGLNESSGSSDFLISARITYLSASSNGIAAGSKLYTEPFAPPVGGLVRSRALDGSNWSALSEAFFSSASRSAGIGDIAVSEIHYRPIGSQTETELAAGLKRKDFEFVELINVSSEAIDLSGIAFTNGIRFTFPEGSFAAAGEHVVIASNIIAFQERYGFDPAGEYDGNLSNDGDRLTLLDAANAVIHDFIYNDRFPWPESPDGDGFSLALISPQRKPLPDHAEPRNWRPSVAPGGSPGISDEIPFTGEPHADSNQNGIADLLDHALGNRGTSPSYSPRVEIVSLDAGDGDLQTFLTITFRRNLAADDVLYSVESSTNLETWSTDAGVFLSAINLGDGRTVETWRSSAPIPDQRRQYLRLRVATK